jgi:hypothetical protein
MLTTKGTLLTKARLAAIALILVLALIVPLNDPDYFWHLKAGEYIVAHGALPTGDIFSFTRFGQPWVLHEWLFEVLLFAAFAMLGPLGVKLLTALFTAATLGVTFAIARRIGRSPGVAFIVLICAAIPFAGGIAPRPQLVTYLCFAVFLFILLSYKYHAAGRSLLVLPLLMVVWVNAHGGYVVGIALACLFTAAEWINYWIAGTRDPVQKQRLVRLTQAACATTLASLLNPGFIEHWLYPFQVLGMAANQRISEWQSPNFHDLGPKLYLLLLVLLAFSYAYAAPRADVTELLIPGFFMFNGFMAGRHIPLAVLAVVPFIALALSRGGTAACAAWWHDSRLRRMYASSLGSGKQLGHGEGALNAVLLVVLVIFLAASAAPFRAREMKRMNELLPVGAVDYVIANDIQGNMFHNYNYGGYLIYRLAPGRKVCIDGRVDVYGDKFFSDYLDIHDGNAAWKEKFDRLAIDFAILDKDAPIRQLLLAGSSFKEVYRDQRHSVLLRTGAHQPALAATSGN